jgi:predicted ATPase
MWPTSDPLKVRIGLHSGEADLRMGDYYGSAVNRCARLRGIGHGGQILLSLATVELTGDRLPAGGTLRDLGLHRLRDLTRPENVFQLVMAGLPDQFPPLKSLEAFAHNLPAQSTPLIGRDGEVATIIELLSRQEVRLLTLSGPGGIGKTRLSLQVGSEIVDRFGDGVFFVPLADATSTDLVVSKIARELEVHESGNQPTLVTLKRYLADKETLLLLDNFEQVMVAAGVVADLLTTSPRLSILATSRTLLNLRGEYDFPVPPLALPEITTYISRDDLSQNGAITLFVDRAQAASPRFLLTDENAPAVAEICRRLDGLPLAIELAAARVRLLSPQALLARLSDRLKLLTGGARDLPLRQQTLRSTIDWSYELLGPEEQTLFGRLSIFIGGFTLEAAETVCQLGDPIDVLEGIEQLLNQSLLRQEETLDGEVRFRMLETIREYSLERLEESGQLEEMRRQHGLYFSEWLTATGYGTLSSEATTALHWIDVEHDNLRATLAWSITSPEGFDLSPILINALGWYWYRRGFVSEGRDWSERVLVAHAGEGPSQARAMALLSAASMAMWQGDLHSARTYADEGVAVSRLLEEPLGLAGMTMISGVVRVNRGEDAEAQALLSESQALFKGAGVDYFTAITTVHLANASLGLGEYDAAADLLQDALGIARQIDEPWLTAFALNNQGEVARAQGQYEVACGYYESSEGLLRELGETGDLARLVHTLGYIAQHEGKGERAEALFRESLATFQRVGNQRGIAECLAGLAGLFAEQGSVEKAAQLLSAASAIQDETGAAWWPADRVEVERNLALIKAALDEPAFEAAWTAGRSMTIDRAIAFVDIESVP